MKRVWSLFVLFALLLLVVGCGRDDTQERCIRIGCFPNVTHVQALVARNMARHGEGWFESRLPGYSFEWLTFNAGPSAMEALFGRTADLCYVGPSPALNAYAVSDGQEVRLLAGAVKGGAALMVRPGAGIRRAEDFRGRCIATPQLGNTQDVSARAWLRRNGLSCELTGGGDCRIAPTPNAMQVQLMKQGELDAAWTVEPWVSTLQQMAGAQLLFEEPEVITTVLVGRVKWLETHPEVAAALIRAHRELTQWILDHPEEARARVTDELSALTRTSVSPAVVAAAWSRLKLNAEIDLAGLQQFVTDAQAVGLLDRVPELSKMIYHTHSD